MLITKDNFDEAIAEIRTQHTFILDVETNGLDAYGPHQICGVGLGYWAYGEETPSTMYFPVRHQSGVNLSHANYLTLIKTLNEVTTTVVGFNLKFDAAFLEKDGLDILSMEMHDVIVMARLSSDTTYKKFDLTTLIKVWISQEAASYDADTKKILRANQWKNDFSLAPPEILGPPYCEKDVLYTGLLYKRFWNAIQKSEQYQLFTEQVKLTKVLYKMEARGTVVDKEYAIIANERILKRQEEVRAFIFKLAGEEFNIQSPAQIGALFNSMGIHSTKVTAKGGKEAWDVEALANVNHPLAGYIGQYRALDKLRTTYVEPWIEQGVLHTTFCNWGTLTGRLSSREPNLQNAPRANVILANRVLSEEERITTLGRLETQISSKGGRLVSELEGSVLDAWGYLGDDTHNEADEHQVSIRRMLIARPGFTLISFDYSQMEVRVFLSYLHNETIDAMLNATDIDFHSETAKLAFGLEKSDPEFKFYRQMAKSITFGIIYGIGKDKLASQLRTTAAKATEYKQRYLTGMEGASDFIKGVMAAVKRRGWVKNRFNRLYRIPDTLGYRGVNYLVQGTSADIMNECLIAVDNYLVDKKSAVLMQVHDEIICEIADEELNFIPTEIRALLQTNSLGIPLTVDMEKCVGSLAVKVDMDTNKLHVEDKFDIIDYIDWEKEEVYA
jgi:DNA polymerase-1